MNDDEKIKRLRSMVVKRDKQIETLTEEASARFYEIKEAVEDAGYSIVSGETLLTIVHKILKEKGKAKC